MLPSHVFLSGLCSGCPFLRPHFTPKFGLFFRPLPFPRIYFPSLSLKPPTLEVTPCSLISNLLFSINSSWQFQSLPQTPIPDFLCICSGGSLVQLHQRWSECLTRIQIFALLDQNVAWESLCFIGFLQSLCALIYKNHWVSISKSHFGSYFVLF